MGRRNFVGKRQRAKPTDLCGGAVHLMGVHLIGVYLIGVYSILYPVKIHLGFLSVKLLGKARGN
jgi:hypothetical protein